MSYEVRKRTFAHAPSKDSDQPAHSRSLIRIFTVRIWIAKDAEFLHANHEALIRLRRLGARQKVHFLTLRQNYWDYSHPILMVQELIINNLMHKN